MNAFVLPGDEYAKDAEQAIDLIDTSIIRHNGAFKFAAFGEIEGFEPFLLKNRFEAQYFALTGHPVLGTIERRYEGGYLVNIGLSKSAFMSENSTHKTQLEAGSTVAAVVLSARIGHQTELKFEKILQNGFLKRISPHRAAQLMLSDELLELGKYFKFDVWIGLNGFLYLSQCTRYDSEGIFECLISDEDAKKIITRRRLLANQRLM